MEIFVLFAILLGCILCVLGQKPLIAFVILFGFEMGKFFKNLRLLLLGIVGSYRNFLIEKMIFFVKK